MRSVIILLALLGTAPSVACNQQEMPNVNSRYTVETVELIPESMVRVSPSLHRDLQKLVGERLNLNALNALGRRIRQETNARDVMQKISKGTQPDHVRVVFEVVRRNEVIRVPAPLLAYHSRQGWTGGVDASLPMGGNRFTGGVVSDGDRLTERFAGIRARFERPRLGTSRVGLRIDAESFHQQWDGATLRAADASDPGAIYRTRRNVEPVLDFRVARPLTLSTGMSFQQLQQQFPAAKIQAANALVTTLRYQRHWEAFASSQRLDAGYDLRAATRTLASDYVYARHAWSSRYLLTRSRQSLSAEFLAGTMTGRTPLFERFVLGNTATLRGWNKFEIAPLGGNRVAHGSVEYRYRFLRAFYDTGAVWDDGEDAAVRHGAGVGLHAGPVLLSVAFPLRDGRAIPVFMLTMAPR